VTLSLEQMDEIIEKTMQVAKHRRHSWCRQPSNKPIRLPQALNS
jgi:hypothetical protein